MKRITVVSIVAASIIGVASGSALINPSPVETTEVTPIVQQVERHEAELDNHEARITNTENDVKDLQDNTNTPPSTNRTEVPVVVTEEPPVEPIEQELIETVVVSSALMIGGQWDGFCKLTYSDETIDYKKAVTNTVDSFDGSHNMSDNCKDYIGQIKE